MSSLVGILALLSSSLAWAEFRVGEEVVVAPNERVPEDLYVFARRVVMKGQVDGDLVAFAGEVEVPGTVAGDLIASSRDVTVSGSVGESIRTASGRLTLNGSVSEDVLAAAGNIKLDSSAKVGRDVVASAGYLGIAAPVGRNVEAAAGTLELSGPVKQDVGAQVGTLKIGPNAKVNGVLRYTSDRPAQVAGGAQVGQVVRSEQAHRGSRGMHFFFGWIRWSVGLFALGMLTRLVFPHLAQTTTQTLRELPWKSLGVGAVVLFGAPILAVGLLAVGGLVGGWWIGLIALGLLATAILVSFSLVGLVLGEFLLERVTHKGARWAMALLVGVLLLALTVRIPLIGGVVALATILLGLGSLALAGLRLRSGAGVPSEAASAP